MRSTVDSGALDTQSELQLGILGALPSDLSSLILSYIDQRDCLECMRVCRTWYDLLPQYATSVWSTVEFFKGDISRESQVQDRFLGNHIKSVIFDKLPETELQATMKKLVSFGCTAVRSVELIRCCTVDHDSFLSLLKQLAPGMTRLEIKAHRSNVALLHLLSVSPKLSHFTYHAALFFNQEDLGIYDQEHEARHPNVLDEFTNLTYLCMDAVVNTEVRLEPILKKSPNLQTFIGTATTTLFLSHLTQHPHSEGGIDLEKLISWCPKIINLAVSSGYSSLEDIQKSLKSKATVDTEQGSSLRTIYMSDIHDIDQIASILTKSQDTLEFFSFRKESLAVLGQVTDWSPIFSSIQMQRLKTFIFHHGVHISGAAIVSLLNNCPCMEILVLSGDPSIILDMSVILHLQTAQMLRVLRCTGIKVEGEYTALALLERLPALEKLSITDSSLMTFNFQQIIQCLKQLVELTLNGVKIRCKSEYLPLPLAFDGCKLKAIVLCDTTNIGYSELAIFAGISTLQILSVSVDDTLYANDDDGLRRFPTLLNAKNLERLEICNVRRLPYIFFDALADLPKLTEVNIFPPRVDQFQVRATHIPMSGLLGLLQRTTSLESISFRKMMLFEDEGNYYLRSEAVSLIREKVSNYIITLREEFNDEAYPIDDIHRHMHYVSICSSTT